MERTGSLILVSGDAQTYCFFDCRQLQRKKSGRTFAGLLAYLAIRRRIAMNPYSEK
jgi:hypothetical protein